MPTMAPHNAICIQFTCNWKRVGQIINSVQTRSQLEEVDISYDGSRICVGDRLSKFDNEGEKGTTRVYDLIGGTWSKVGQDINGSKFQDKRASCGLSPDGQRLIIGGPTASNNGKTRNGRVEVFDFDGSVWYQVGQTIYGADTWYHIGGSSQIVGADNSIMAHKSENPRDNTGYIRVFRLVGNTWQNIGDLYGEQPGDRMGGDFKISHDGKRVIAGSLYSKTVCTGGGSAYMGYAKVFEYNADNVWNQLDILCYAVEGDDQRFGSTVTMSGDGNRIAVAARNWNGGLGYAVAYDIVDDGDGTYSYSQLGQILYGVREGSNGPFFGYRLSMTYDGSRLLANAPYDHSQRGRIRIFDLKDNQWELAGDPISGADVPFQALEIGNYATIAGNGERFIFSNRFYNNGSGQAFVFEYGKD